jgi:hypothetical protein
MADLVQCRRPFVAFEDGRRVRVAAGDLYSANDPLAVAHAAAFGPLDVKSSTVPKVAPSRTAAATETGSAEPGSRRNLSRSPRSSSSAKAKDEDDEQEKGGDSDA